MRNDKQVSEPSSSHVLVYRPNTGLQSRSEKLKDLLRKYSQVEPAEAEVVDGSVRVLAGNV